MSNYVTRRYANISFSIFGQACGREIVQREKYNNSESAGERNVYCHVEARVYLAFPPRRIG